MDLKADFQIEYPPRRLTYRCHLHGHAWGVFGQSGAGKTSFFNAIAGFLTPATGSLALNGEVFVDRGRSLLPPHKRKVGFVFQEDRLFPHLTVAGNLKFAEGLRSSDHEYPTLDRLSEIFEIGYLLKRSIHNLSGGERRRVAIARALLCQPDLLLMDEPFIGLDASMKAKILWLLRELMTCRGLELIVSTHHLDDLLFLSHNLILVDSGAIVSYGPYEELLRDRTPRPLLGTCDRQSVEVC